jgi:hypothetical protein
MTRIAAVSVAVALLAGCSHMAPTETFSADYRSANDGAAWGGLVTIQVDNQRPQSMIIFAINDRVRVFVGQVGSRQSGTFQISRSLLGPNDWFRLHANPVQSTLDQESDVIDAKDVHTVAWLLRPGGGNRVRMH